MSASFPLSIKNFGNERVNGDYIPASDMNDVRAELAALESAALGGWMTMPETFTYVSAQSFRLAGVRTAAYSKGRRVRWYQSVSARYGVIAGSSYSAPNTTVTILTSFEYAFSNAVITSLALSDLENPQGWPGWFSWLPTYSASGGMTFTSVSTQLARYRVSGRTVFFMLRAIGTTSGTQHTELRASLPVTALAVTGNVVPFHADVTDSAAMLGRGLIDTNGQLLGFGRYDGAVFGIGAGRVLAGQGCYEW